MDQRNLTIRGRNPSSPPDLNAAGEPTLEGFDNVAGGPERPKLVLKFDICNNNRRSFQKPDQSSSLVNPTEPPKGDWPPDGDYSNYRDPTLRSVTPKCRRLTDEGGTLSESSSEDLTDTICAFTSANDASKMSTVIITASVGTRKAPRRSSKRHTENQIQRSRSTECSVSPKEGNSDLETLLKDLADLKISGTVQSESYSRLNSRAIQTTHCGKSISRTTCTGSNMLNHPSASGINMNRATPTVTLESAATSVEYLISDLYRYYGSRMSVLMSLNSDDRCLPSLLEALHSSMHAFRGHPNSLMMFHMVNERRVVLTLPKIRSAIIDVNHLVQDYRLENNRASSRATRALEHIYSLVRMLFEDLHPIDNEIQAALSVLEDEWGPTC